MTRETQLYIIHLQVGNFQPQLPVYKQGNDITRVSCLPFFIRQANFSGQRNTAIERMPPNFEKEKNKDKRDEAGDGERVAYERSNSRICNGVNFSALFSVVQSINMRSSSPTTNHPVSASLHRLRRYLNLVSITFHSRRRKGRSSKYLW